MTQSLYDQDFLLWTEDIVSKLQARDFEHLDVENLIEEVESLGRSEKRELLSRLTTLMEYLLKRMYVQSPDNYRGWEATIREQRRQLTISFEDTPSLKAIWETSFDRAWHLAIMGLREEYPQVVFPDRWQLAADPEDILNQKFWT